MNNNRSGGIKNLVLRHIEKVVALGVLGVAGYLVYVSTSIEQYDKQAGDLTQVIGQTRDAWDRSTWNETPEENKHMAFDPTDKGAGQVNVEQYAEARGWSKPVVPPTVERTDPTLIAAADVEGIGVTGLFGFINEDILRQRQLEEERKRQEEERKRREEQEQDRDEGPTRGGRFGQNDEDENDGRRPAGVNRLGDGVEMNGDELIRTVSCAVVLAKAPLLDQYKVYKEALENARGYNPSNDFPYYLGYVVQRAEVREGKTGEWAAVRVTDGQGKAIGNAYKAGLIDRLTEEWVQGAEPYVDPAYEDPALTMPLPPLVGEPWPTSVVHSDVPLAIETELAEMEAERELDEPEEEIDSDGFSFNSPSRRNRGPAGRGFSEGRGGSSRAFRGATPSRGGRSGGSRFSSGGRSGGPSRSSGFGRSRRGESEPETPHLMVRFFDFTVVPGKQYRYRVQLVLQDVNAPEAVDKNYLDREAAARVSKAGYRPFRLTEWSKPGSIISIPMAGDVRIAGVKLPSKGQVNSEGSVKFLVRSYSVDDDGRATRSGIERTVPIGAVMNMTEDAEVVTPDQRWIVKVDDFEFRTGITLLDFRGGDDITREYTAPIRALLMDPSGRLFIRHEIDDSEAITNHKVIFENEDDNRGGFQGGRGFPGGGRGGRGGGRGGEFEFQ